ncbi:hypothetical protein [Mycolicibacterium smegmatis]|uniref:hypothetical protein n=1 Tax=Mycolicibacterium smegmatis TaxID=1772 RepID=UPI0018EEF9B6|nr:hypothetical protein [Mycolicibacterium smegmatis]
MAMTLGNPTDIARRAAPLGSDGVAIATADGLSVAGDTVAQTPIERTVKDEWNAAEAARLG